MNKSELKIILEKHNKWLNGEDGGECANLSNANLSYADLSRADLSYVDLIMTYLRGANLIGANLTGANLSNTNLRGADLTGANLSGANLIGADLRFADLTGADLSGANLSYADLMGANLTGATLLNIQHNENTSFFALQCPEKGSFIGWKKCKNGLIVELKIPTKAKRSSATSRKCRCSEAKVIAIYDENHNKADVNYAISSYDCDFKYEVGKIVKVDDFDENRWNECSTGIYFFLTFDEARRYNL